MSNTLKAFRDGKSVSMEGASMRMIPGDIQPGDFYVAERNTGPHLLTCLRVNHEGGWIVPVERAYCYDISECVRVEMVD